MKIVTIGLAMIATQMLGQMHTGMMFEISSDRNMMTSSDHMMTSAWNFVEEAKNLTDDEKRRFNDQATAARNVPFGLGGNVETIASQVKALDAQREVEKILKEAEKILPIKLTVEWIGSVVVQHHEKEGENSWSFPGAGARWGMRSNPEIEIGFRSDGVVVWRKRENTEGAK